MSCPCLGLIEVEKSTNQTEASNSEIVKFPGLFDLQLHHLNRGPSPMSALGDFLDEGYQLLASQMQWLRLYYFSPFGRFERRQCSLQPLFGHHARSLLNISIWDLGRPFLSSSLPWAWIPSSVALKVKRWCHYFYAIPEETEAMKPPRCEEHYKETVAETSSYLSSVDIDSGGPDFI